MELNKLNRLVIVFLFLAVGFFYFGSHQAQAAVSLSVSPSSISVGQKAVFSFSTLPANATIQFRATRSEDGSEQDIPIQTGSSGKLDGSLVFQANKGEEGHWSGYAKIRAAEFPDMVTTNTVTWQVVAATTGGGQGLSNGQACDGNNSVCASGYCNTTEEVCADKPAVGGAGGSNSGTAGAVCIDDSRCVPGSNCCNPGLACVSGTCQVPGNNNNNNSNNSNNGGSGSCPSGLSMVNGLCLPTNSQFGSGIAGTKSLSELLIKVIQILLTFAGIIAVSALVIGGFWYITSGGNEELAEKGKKAIINAIIGLVVVILAYAIVTIISATLTGADRLLTQ